MGEAYITDEVYYICCEHEWKEDFKKAKHVDEIRAKKNGRLLMQSPVLLSGCVMAASVGIT